MEELASGDTVEPPASTVDGEQAGESKVRGPGACAGTGVQRVETRWRESGWDVDERYNAALPGVGRACVLSEHAYV
jgi:hypothetical protein